MRPIGYPGTMLPLAPPAGLPPEKPNIILIQADDLGYGEVGFMGQTRIKTPHLDRLAREGMVLTSHYAGAPVCAPSRSSILEGKSLLTCQIRDNKELPGPFYGAGAPEGQWPLREGTKTIGTVLQGAGYRTGIVGKWGTGGPGSTGRPNRQGFDFFYGYLCQRQAHSYYPEHLWRNEEKAQLPNDWTKPGRPLQGDPNDPASYAAYSSRIYAQDAIHDAGIDFIRRACRTPFFLYAAYPAPHLPLQVPQDSLVEYLGQWDDPPYTGGKGYFPHQTPRAAYAAMITRMDRQIGEIRSELERLGLERKTLILFTSDNGPTHDAGGVDTGFFQSAGPLRGRKGSVEEGGIRVPALAWWPGRVPAGARSDFPSAGWDYMKTFAELAGAHAPSDAEGISLAGALQGREPKSRPPLAWAFPGYGGQAAVRIGPWKAMRRGLKQSPDAPWQLYDLDKDIAESRNLASEHPEIIAQAERILAARTPAILPEWSEWLDRATARKELR